MSQVDRETSVPLDPVVEAGALHNRVRSLEEAFRERLGELALSGASPAEKMRLRAIREDLEGIEVLARTAIATYEGTNIPLRASAEETLAGDAAYAAVRSFADSEGGGFTMAQLKAHLQNLGYELPSDAKTLSRQFADWQQQIIAEKTKAGEQRRWVKLNARTYALAWLGAPPVVRQEPLSAAPPAISLRPGNETEPEPSPAKLQAPEETSELALKLVADSPSDHGGVLVERLAQRTGSDISGAWLVFNQLVDAGKLRQEKVGGAVFLRSSAEDADTERTAAEEDPASLAALRIVRESSGEPAKILIGQLIKEMNLPAPAARRVFEDLVQGGRIHRHSAAGRVRYSAEPPERRPLPAASSAVESSSTPPLPSVSEVQVAQQVLRVLTGKGVPFGKTFTLQEISQQLGWDGDPDNFDGKPSEVRTAANYLWSLGYVTRIETRGKLKLQLADRAIMRGMKSDQGRADIVAALSSGFKYVPPQNPARRRPAKKKP